MRLPILPLLLLVLLCGWRAHGQLVWEKPLQQFERSPDDKFVEASYPFRNAGGTPITIRSLRSSCGCTTARLDKKTYAPGEKGEVTLRFTFGDRRGLYRKGVSVITDEKGAEPTVLNLLVDIHEPLTISPALVFWRKGEASAPKLVTLDASPREPVRIKSVASSNPRFTATLQPGIAGQRYAIAITPADTAQKDAAEIRVQTDFPADAPRAYTIHARIK